MNKDFSRASTDIRKNIVRLIHLANAPHVGSALSCVELLVASYELSDIEKIKNHADDRNIIVLSKGHAIAAQLAVLYQYGFYEADIFDKFCKTGTHFFENTSTYTRYIECATGSLGQGASFGVGNALGMKLKHYNDCKTFVILGDGELNEGQCWEAFEQAACLGLDNLVVLVDSNRLSGIDAVCCTGSIEKKMRAFGFETSAVNGHDVQSIIDAVISMKAEGRPKAVICDTIKGKGISFMENDNNWHYRPISEKDYERAVLELDNEKHSREADS